MHVKQIFLELEAPHFSQNNSFSLLFIKGFKFSKKERIE
jgi:hypothetical protein